MISPNTKRRIFDSDFVAKRSRGKLVGRHKQIIKKLSLLYLLLISLFLPSASYAGWVYIDTSLGNLGIVHNSSTSPNYLRLGADLTTFYTTDFDPSLTWRAYTATTGATWFLPVDASVVPAPTGYYTQAEFDAAGGSSVMTNLTLVDSLIVCSACLMMGAGILSGQNR